MNMKLFVVGFFDLFCGKYINIYIFVFFIRWVELEVKERFLLCYINLSFYSFRSFLKMW